MHTPTHAIEAFEKVRSMKKAKLRCEQIFDEDIADLTIQLERGCSRKCSEKAAWLDKLQGSSCFI